MDLTFAFILTIITKKKQEYFMPTIIDGRGIAKNIKDQVAQQIRKLDSKPRMAVIQVGSNTASSIYVKHKLKACAQVGIETVSANLHEDTTQESLLGLIEGFNNSDAFNGILVQLPLPQQIQVEPVIEAIDPVKDVDGFHPLNVGRLTVRSGTPYLHPCTPWGIVHMLDTVFPKKGKISGLRGKKVVVIGQSYILGRPLSVMLQNEGATVCMCDAYTPDLKEEVRGADVLVGATGVAQLINEELFLAVDNPDVTIIDAGITKLGDKTVGDIHQDLYNRLKTYSPVPGGVGPVTIAFLMRNVLKAYCMQKGLPLPTFK